MVQKEFNKTRFHELIETGQIYDAIAEGERLQAEQLGLLARDSDQIKILGGSAFRQPDEQPALDADYDYIPAQ